MKTFIFVVAVCCISNVVAMPQKVSLSPMSSMEEDYGAARNLNSLQNLAANSGRYQIYLIAPGHMAEQRHSLDDFRGLTNYDLIQQLFKFTPKRYVDKKSIGVLDSIGGGHLI